MAGAGETDMRRGQAGEGQQRSPLAAPVGRQLILVGIDGIVGAAAGVATMDIGEGATECAEIGQIFGATARAPTVDIVGRGIAHALAAAKGDLLQPEAEAAVLGTIDAVGVGQDARGGSGTRCHRFERATGMIGQHLAQIGVQRLAIADGEIGVGDIGVIVERIVDGGIGATERAGEAQVGHALGRDREGDGACRGIARDAALEHIGQQGGGAERRRSAERSGADDDIVAFRIADLAELHLHLRSAGEAGCACNVIDGVGTGRRIDGNADGGGAAGRQ